MALLILSDVKQARSRKLLSTVLYEISNDMISRYLLIFGVWGMEQKVLIFDHAIDVRDEPFMNILTTYFYEKFKVTNLRFPQNTEVGFEIVASNSA